jgi:hypothetical protein
MYVISTTYFVKNQNVTITIIIKHEKMEDKNTAELQKEILDGVMGPI